MSDHSPISCSVVWNEGLNFRFDLRWRTLRSRILCIFATTKHHGSNNLSPGNYADLAFVHGVAVLATSVRSSPDDYAAYLALASAEQNR